LASEYRTRERYIGMDIVTSDGTTLSAGRQGGDRRDHDAVDISRSPEIKRGAIKIGLRGRGSRRGTKYFDVKSFGANFAYTLDGGPLGEIEFGRSTRSRDDQDPGVAVHPGYAKDKLVNAIRSRDIVARLPRHGSEPRVRQGYIHP